MPTCRFGHEAEELSKEHIFGRAWVERVMPMPDGAKLQHRHTRLKGQPPFGADGEKGFDLTWEAREASLVAPDICKACNNGWMDSMDKATHPYIDPLVAGEARSLDSAAQVQIARWGTKLAILLDSHLDPPTLSPDVWCAFYETQEPFPDAHVWVARYDLPPGAWRGGGTPTMKSDSPPDGPPCGYACTISANYLIVHVLIPVDGFDIVPVARTWERVWGGHVRRIWPPLVAAPVDWPPPMGVAEDEYNRFASMEEPPAAR